MPLRSLEVTVSSLHEVVKYFQEKTEYQLLPYTLSEAYDTHIGQSPPPRVPEHHGPCPRPGLV